MGALSIDANNASSDAVSTTTSDAVSTGASTDPPLPPEPESAKWARCKHCGLNVTRTMDAIEAHMVSCSEVAAAASRNKSTDKKPQPRTAKFNVDDYLGVVTDEPGPPASLGGVVRNPELEEKTAQIGHSRVIYRVSKSTYPSLIRPREACVLQDSFADDDGTVYVYEVSVLHPKAYGSKGHVSEEVRRPHARAHTHATHTVLRLLSGAF